MVICGMSMGERSQWAAGVCSSSQEVCSGLFLRGRERSWESIFSCRSLDMLVNVSGMSPGA